VQLKSAMYDYARGNCVLPQTLEEIIVRCASNKLNALMIYIEDIALFVRPELHKGTLDLDRLKELDSFAQAHGVTLIPGLALLAHASQSLRHEEFAELADTADVFDPKHPRTMELLSETLRVAAETFSGPYIHLGCDETWDLRREGPVNEAWPVELFCDHVNRLTEITLKLGRRPMFWCDMISRYYPELIGKLNPQLIAVDWFYHIDKDYPTIGRWTEHGFDVVVGPTIGFQANILARMAWPAANIRALIDAGFKADALGVILSSWEHQHVGRYQERQQMNFLGGTLASEGLQRSNDEILHEYWQKKMPGREDDVLAFYRCCDRFAALLPARFNDCCDEPLERRSVWLGKYEGARESLGELEKLEQQIAELAQRIEPAADAYQPFRTAALRARHALALGRLERNDVDTMFERIDRLEELSRLEWGSERALLADNFDRQVGRFYVRQRQVLSDIVGGKKTPPQAAREIDEVTAVYGGFAEEPALSALTRRDNGTAEQEKTKFWFSWDERGLNIRVVCEQGGAIRRAEDRVDTILTRDDIIVLQIDAEHQHRDSVWVEVNPAGRHFAEIRSTGAEQSAVQHIVDPRLPLALDVSAEVRKGWWEVTMAIPFAALHSGRPTGDANWGLAVERHNRHSGQVSHWGGDPLTRRSDPRALGHLVFQGG